MATPDDAAAVCALYNWYVRHGVQTFQYTPSTVEDYRANIEEVLQHAPFLLAESADGRLRGFACAHLWHTREAYAGMLKRPSTVRPTASVRAWAAGSTAPCWRC